ncbi:MAG: flagellar assembly protein FliX, partial [Methylobacterium brachiatum]|nr:flagellar assembly protein FliX [Methylobacterium brachiatum]
MPTRQVLPPCLPVLNPAGRVSGKRRGARSDTNTIMRVETRQPIQNAGGVAAKARVEGGRGFSLDAAPASASGTGAPAAAATLAGLDAVLLLQGEAETPQERRRRAAKRGH